MKYYISTVGSAHRIPTCRVADLRIPKHRLAPFERDVVSAGARLLLSLPSSIKAHAVETILFPTLKRFLMT